MAQPFMFMIIQSVISKIIDYKLDYIDLITQK